MAEMLNANQDIYPREGALCLLVETVSHHRDFEELSSSKLHRRGHVCGHHGKGEDSPARKYVPQQEKYIRRILGARQKGGTET